MREGVSTIEAAASWGADLLTGSTAISVAVLAVALVGSAMMRGIFAWREGLRIVFGCFILFGSSAVAKELVSRVLTPNGGVAVQVRAFQPLDMEKFKSPPIRATNDPFNPNAARAAQ